MLEASITLELSSERIKASLAISGTFPLRLPKFFLRLIGIEPASTRDWSELPHDLVFKISTHLNNYIEFHHLRSVCHAWRSSLPHLPLTPKLPYPFLPRGYPGVQPVGFCTLVKNTIYLLQPHDQLHSSSCVVKVEERTPNSLRIINPLSRIVITSLRRTSPSILSSLGVNFKAYRVLSNEYYLENSNPESDDGCSFRKFRTRTQQRLNYFSIKKVILSPNAANDTFVAVALDCAGSLLLFMSGYTHWTRVQVHGSSLPFHDLINYKGKFYAVDCKGKTWVIAPQSSSVIQGAKNVIHCPNLLVKHFVESNGELFLVVVAENVVHLIERKIETINDSVLIKYVQQVSPIGCTVHKLDQENKKWVMIESLEDQVFFVGLGSSFSISASDFLPGCKGNCILVANHKFMRNSDSIYNGIGVFNIEDGTWNKLENCPTYSRLFCPLPTWIETPN